MKFIFLDNVCISYLSCNVKEPQKLTTAKLSIKSINKRRSNLFFGVLCEVHAYTVTDFTVAQHESGTRQTITLTVTVYNTQLSSQCNLTAQIAPVQDKCIYICQLWSVKLKIKRHE